MPTATDRRRLAAQLLAGPRASSPVGVVEHLLAVQAQDLRGARLAVRARTEGVSASDVDRALTDDRSLVVSWLNRGTLHLVRSEDYWWLHPLTAPQLLSGTTRRLRQEGVSSDDAERGVAVVVDTIAARGPATRQLVREQLTDAGVPAGGQALVHLGGVGWGRGGVVRGRALGAEQAFVLTEDWLGPRPPDVPREEALARLARRYLAGHGPASARDLAKWAGIPLTAARSGLAALHGDVDELGDGLLALPGPAPVPDLPPPLLLGAFDPLLHGWTSREPVLGRHQGVVTSNGLFRPFALVEGRAAGTWRLPGGRVVLEPFGRLPATARAALDEEAADVVRFLAT